jgi:hypothetical protein
MMDRHRLELAEHVRLKDFLLVQLEHRPAAFVPAHAVVGRLAALHTALWGKNMRKPASSGRSAAR